MRMKKEDYMKIVAFRQELHQHPELSNHEEQTRSFIKKFIQENMSKYNIYDEGTWLYCMKPYCNGHKTIVIRADHDAILNSKGVPFHGCGHDGHTAILLGLMMEQEDIEIDTNVIYLFQPAEENGSGAAFCSPLFERYHVDEVYGMHNMPGLEKNVIYYRPETVMCASVGYHIRLRGIQSHASEPEKGRNPAFVLSEFVKAIQPLSQSCQFESFQFGDISFSSLAMITVIYMNVGSMNFGISPANGEIALTLRAAKEGELLQLEKYVLDYFARVKDQFEVEIEMFDRFDENYTDPQLAKKSIEKLQAAGMPVKTLEYPIRASEDFGYYKKFAPTVFFLVGTGDCPSLHHDAYRFDDEIIDTSIQMYQTIINH